MSNGFIIYGIVLFICIAMTSRMDDLFAKVLMWAQVLFVGLFVLNVKGLDLWAVLLYLATLPAIVVYALVRKHIPMRDKVLMALSAIFVLLATVFRIQHYTGAMVLQYLGLLSIVSLLLLMFRGSNKYFNEIGILFVLAVVSGYGFINFLVG